MRFSKFLKQLIEFEKLYGDTQIDYSKNKPIHQLYGDIMKFVFPSYNNEYKDPCKQLKIREKIYKDFWLHMTRFEKSIAADDDVFEEFKAQTYSEYLKRSSFFISC